jgi:hypothetical protein
MVSLVEGRESGKGFQNIICFPAKTSRFEGLHPQIHVFSGFSEAQPVNQDFDTSSALMEPTGILLSIFTGM